MEMKNPHLIWALVVMVFIITTGAVLLVLAGRDFTVILSIMAALVIPIMSAFGVAVYQKLAQVQTTSNGNMTKALEQNAAIQQSILNMFRELHPGLKGTDEGIL